jgi:hypothetical protein
MGLLLECILDKMYLRDLNPREVVGNMEKMK